MYLGLLGSKYSFQWLLTRQCPSIPRLELLQAWWVPVSRLSSPIIIILSSTNMTSTLNTQDANALSTANKPFLKRSFRPFHRNLFQPQDAQDNQDLDVKIQSFNKLHKFQFKVLWRKKKSIIGADPPFPATAERPKAYTTEMKSNSTPVTKQWKKKLMCKKDCGPKLNYIKSALKILAAVGDGVAPVPGLKGVAGIALEIVRVVEVIYL